MTDDLVDRIVRGVLDSLQSPAVAVRSSVVSSATPSLEAVRSAVASTLPPVVTTAPAVTSPAIAVVSNELRIIDAVVTGPALEAVWKNQTSVHLVAKAILTPSAREFLKKRKIEVVRGGGRIASAPSTGVAAMSGTTQQNASSAGTRPTGNAAASWRVFVVQTHPQLDRVLEDAARGGSTKVDRVVPGAVQEATAAAVTALTRAEIDGGILLTHQTLVAACRANRHMKIRAASVASVIDVNAARRQLSPNLFCIDPTGKSYFELRNLMKSIIAGGPPQAPAGWTE